jgi:predicted ATP-dependent protease
MIPLPPDLLARQTNAAELPFRCTSELNDISELIGQSRASEAIQFGINICHDGYNIYVAGPVGSGKQTLVRQLVESRAQDAAPPCDWCYVHNFLNAHRPIAIGLPAGLGRELSEQMAQAVEYLKSAVPALFAGEEYRSRRDTIMKDFVERQEDAFKKLSHHANSLGIAFLRTPRGFAFVPQKGEEIIEPQEFERLPEQERTRLLGHTAELQSELEKILDAIPHWWRERAESLKTLDQETLKTIVWQMLEKIRQQFIDHPAVVAYLDSVARDITGHSEVFRTSVTNGSHDEHGSDGRHLEFMDRYKVNVLVGDGLHHGAPIVAEENPSYPNLIGRIEHMSEMGTLVTNFTLIKAGALHRANGGYLLLDIRRVLSNPFSWEALKRALRSREIRIESLPQVVGLISTVSLEPEPIPLNLKVILLGDRFFYYLLAELDPDFLELFKVTADFDDRVMRNNEANLLYAQMLASMVRRYELMHLDDLGVARVIDHAARLAGDAYRLTMHARSILDLLQEADHIARLDKAMKISESHVQRAIDARVHRLSRYQQRIHEEILRGTVLIDTTMSTIGQINGLSVVELGNFTFSQPVRITAKSRFGTGDLINIEREAELSGALHSKGVLILAGFLSTRFAKSQPFALNASIVMEQSYGRVDGDSASLAELCALMSDLAGVPIDQHFAVTGSVNQMGEVQPIGKVNEKVEGFYDICCARGFDGRHAVVIPVGNLDHLMLKREVVEAARCGHFHVYAVRSVDEAISLLTGSPAGLPDAAGTYPRHSVNGRIAERIRQLSGVQRATRLRVHSGVGLGRAAQTPRISLRRHG